MKKILCLLTIIIFSFGLVACASDANSEVIVNPTKDKVTLPFSGTDTIGEQKEGDVITGVYFKAENVSKETFTFEDVIFVAYDKDLNILEATSDNEPVELAPGKRSKKFKYFFDGNAEFVKIVGYQYRENGKIFIDTFESTELFRGTAFGTVDVNKYSDKEILEKAYKKQK